MLENRLSQVISYSEELERMDAMNDFSVSYVRSSLDSLNVFKSIKRDVVHDMILRPAKQMDVYRKMQYQSPF